MTNIKALIKQVKRFPVMLVARESGLSRRNVYAIINEQVTNPTISTVMALEKAVTRLESVAAKTKSIKKPAKKQTAVRDKRGAVVVGGKA